MSEPLIQSLINLNQNLSLGFEGTLITLIFTILISLLITRNSEDLKLILFPINIAIIQIGFKMNILLLIILGILFVLTLYKENKIISTFITKLRLNKSE